MLVLLVVLTPSHVALCFLVLHLPLVTNIWWDNCCVSRTDALFCGATEAVDILYPISVHVSPILHNIQPKYFASSSLVAFLCFGSVCKHLVVVTHSHWILFSFKQSVSLHFLFLLKVCSFSATHARGLSQPTAEGMAMQYTKAWHPHSLWRWLNFIKSKRDYSYGGAVSWGTAMQNPKVWYTHWLRRWLEFVKSGRDSSYGEAVT